MAPVPQPMSRCALQLQGVEAPVEPPAPAQAMPAANAAIVNGVERQMYSICSQAQARRLKRPRCGSTTTSTAVVATAVVANAVGAKLHRQRHELDKSFLHFEWVAMELQC